MAKLRAGTDARCLVGRLALGAAVLFALEAAQAADECGALASGDTFITTCMKQA